MTGLADLGIRLRHPRPGEHRTACPECATTKNRPGDDALGVRLEANGRAVWQCFRCGWAGATGGEDRHARGRPARRLLAPLEPPPRAVELPDAAASLWQGCRPITPGTVAAAYLEGRGCALPHPEGDLRWHPELRHPSGHAGPGLVGLVTDAISGEPRTVHRTWLKGDGSGKAEVDKPRLLWPGLHKAGGVVRLWPDEAAVLALAVAEGVETALALARGFGLAWACLDAGNLAGLPVLGGIEALTIAADHDQAGLKAADDCARRWLEAGREVRLWRSPTAGADMNDFARGAA